MLSILVGAVVLGLLGFGVTAWRWGGGEARCLGGLGVAAGALLGLVVAVTLGFYVPHVTRTSDVPFAVTSGGKVAAGIVTVCGSGEQDLVLCQDQRSGAFLRRIWTEHDKKDWRYLWSLSGVCSCGKNTNQYELHVPRVGVAAK